MFSWWKSSSSETVVERTPDVLSPFSLSPSPSASLVKSSEGTESWSYPELCTPTTLEDFEELESSTFNAIVNHYRDSKNEGWELLAVDKGISLSQKTVANSPYGIMKCSGLIEGANLQQLHFMFSDVSLEEKKFTPELKEQFLLRDISPSCKLIKSVFDSGTPGISDRSFVAIRCTNRLSDGTEVIFGVSVNYIQQPFERQVVRATQLAGVFITPVPDSPNSVFLTTIDFVDPKGWIPAFIVNFFKLKAIDRVKTIRKLFEELPKK